MTRSLRYVRHVRNVAIVGLVAVLATLDSGPVVQPTDAAWVDEVHVAAPLGSGSWSVDGSAVGEAVGATLSNTLVAIPVVVGPIGPLQRSAAGPTDRGPHSASTVSLAVPGLGIAGVVNATVGAEVVSTSAEYSPTSAQGTAAIAGAAAGMNLLEIAVLDELLDVGALHTAAACGVGSANAEATPLADVAVELLGSPVSLDAEGKATASVTLGLVNVQVTVGFDRVAQASTTPNPSAEASYSVVVDVRASALLPLAQVRLELPLVSSACELHVPAGG